MEPEKDLRQYWRALLSRKHYFIWPALAIMAIAGIVALSLPPVYESQSTILIEEQQIPPEFVRSTVTGYADQRIQSLNQQILSRTKLLEIIRQFDLYADMRQKKTQEEIIETMRENISIGLIGAEADKKRKRSGGEGGVTIAFTVAYRGKNPEVVQKVAGTLASLYLQENIKIWELQAKTTTKFLENELKELQERIKTIGQQITEFKAKNEDILPELQQFNRSQVEHIEKDIDQIKVQIQAAEDRKILLEGQLATVNTDTSIKDASPQTRLHQLQVALCDLQARFPDNHPEIRKVKREMAELEKITGTSGGGTSLKKESLPSSRPSWLKNRDGILTSTPRSLSSRRRLPSWKRFPSPSNLPRPWTSQKIQLTSPLLPIFSPPLMTLRP